VEYHGGPDFPSGRPISDNIEKDVAGIDSEYYDLIVGTWVPIQQKICWTVPTKSSTTPNQLWFYDLRTNQWSFEDKAMRYVDAWQMWSGYTWSNLITAFGAAWNTTAALPESDWAEFLSSSQRLVYGPTDGKLYYQTGESLPAGVMDGHRIEPVIDFGNPYRKDLLKEIWFDLTEVGDFNIDVWHRSGDTLGETVNQSWTSLGSLSCDSPDVPALRNFAKSGRMHQIKWGADTNNNFGINGITLKYTPESGY
jgi:hypothetical protein